MTRSEIKECRDCGAAVLNERAHRQFHDNVVTVDPQPSQQVTPRFVGVDDDPDLDRTNSP